MIDEAWVVVPRRHPNVDSDPGRQKIPEGPPMLSAKDTHLCGRLNQPRACGRLNQLVERRVEAMKHQACSNIGYARAAKIRRAAL